MPALLSHRHEYTALHPTCAKRPRKAYLVSKLIFITTGRQLVAAFGAMTGT